jgi:vitamin B12 transporter
MLTRFKNLAYFSCLATSLGLLTPTYAAEELPALTVMGQETANQRPVTTFETPLSNLDFDPRVDFQSRNMAEAQGDISIRGGTFENTGVQVGSATLLDPQTGHYMTELPIAPEMLSEPKILTGADNALRGFNSNTGTVSYSWSEITKGGSLTIGGGDHNLNFQRIHHALTGSYGNSKDWTWGAEIEGSRSESDGTIPYGDHAFDRTSGRIQLLGPDSQTDLFVGYQDKFYGWPGMYTANTDNHETEDYQIELFLLNHTQQYANGYFELTGFHRTLADEFYSKRENPVHYQAKHKNLVNGFGLFGKHDVNKNFSINHSAQFTYDNMKSSKTIYKNKVEPWNLKQGDFTDRQYYKISLLPEYNYTLSDDEVITYKGGISWDDSNRDKQRFSPLAEVSWTRNDGDQHFESAYLSYSESTQVLGYGAIGGPTSSGTFQSTIDLNRSISKNLEIGINLKRKNWSFNSAIFHRWDEDLVDWTYSNTSPNSRKANHADINTFGFEIIASHQWDNFQAICSYSYLEKDENYKDLNIDGSFYALNYPEHRATLGLIWDPIDTVQIRVDNEWREQRENIIRTQTGAPNKSTFSHLAASYFPQKFEDLELFLAYDKPWEKDFQDIPGIAPRGDQFSFGATYSW